MPAAVQKEPRFSYRRLEIREGDVSPAVARSEIAGKPSEIADKLSEIAEKPSEIADKLSEIADKFSEIAGN